MHSYKTTTSIAILTALLSTTGYADVSEQRNFEFDLRSGDSFDISNINGDVEVRTGNIATVEAFLEASKQEYLDNIEIEIDESNGSVSIDTELPRRMRNGHASVDYIVTLPNGVTLESVETVNGDLEIIDRAGEIHAETVNGDIQASGLSGDIDLETVNGGIDIDFIELSGNDSIDLETVNGSIKVEIPSNADVTVFAENLNGGLKMSDLDIIKQTKSKWTSAESVEAVSGSGSAQLTADSVNGSIRISKD